MKNGHAEFRSVRIEKAENGFTVHKDYEGEYGNKPAVFTSVSEVLAEVKKCLSGSKKTKKRKDYSKELKTKAIQSY